MGRSGYKEVHFYIVCSVVLLPPETEAEHPDGIPECGADAMRFVYVPY